MVWSNYFVLRFYVEGETNANKAVSELKEHNKGIYLRFSSVGRLSLDSMAETLLVKEFLPPFITFLEFFEVANVINYLNLSVFSFYSRI